MSSEYHNGGNAEADEKMGLAALFTQSATAGIAATGVLYGLAVTQTATASGSVQVAQGAGVVQGSLTAGASLLVNPAPTVDVFTANPVGSLPRNDIIAFDALTATAKVYVGTANATPTDPTVPNTALKMARIRNAANATTIPAANIDDLRVYTRLAGVDVPAYSSHTQVSGQTITTSTWTLMQGWTTVAQSNITYSVGQFTLQVPGRYKIAGALTFPAVASPAGQRAVRLYVNSTLLHEYSGIRGDATYITCLPFEASISAVAGDVISVQVFQSQGASMVTVAGAAVSHIEIDRVNGT